MRASLITLALCAAAVSAAPFAGADEANTVARREEASAVNHRKQGGSPHSAIFGGSGIPVIGGLLDNVLGLVKGITDPVVDKISDINPSLGGTLGDILDKVHGVVGQIQDMLDNSIGGRSLGGYGFDAGALTGLVDQLRSYTGQVEALVESTLYQVNPILGSKARQLLSALDTQVTNIENEVTSALSGN